MVYIQYIYMHMGVCMYGLKYFNDVEYKDIKGDVFRTLNHF